MREVRCGISCFVFFFFQAEDGIRDYKVTGVQTCALPISKPLRQVLEETNLTDDEHALLKQHCERLGIEYLCTAYCREAGDFLAGLGEIGRASCRERV